jgi:hypothetical protein
MYEAAAINDGTYFAAAPIPCSFNHGRGWEEFRLLPAGGGSELAVMILSGGGACLGLWEDSPTSPESFAHTRVHYPPP